MRAKPVPPRAEARGARLKSRRRAVRATGMTTAMLALAAGLVPSAIATGVVGTSLVSASKVAASVGPDSPGANEPTGPRIGKIRIADFYLLPNGKPGPALDFYDTSERRDVPRHFDIATGKPASHSNDPTSPATLSDYNAALFPLPIGTHTLNVVAEPGPGMGLSQKQCRAAAAVTTMTVKLAKSPPTLLFIYGANPHQAKMMTVKIG